MLKKYSTRPVVPSELRRIHSRLATLDLICNGTVLKRTKVCGKPNCRCARDPDARHGPYYEWSRLENGKLLHSVLPPSKAKEIERAIANHKRLLEVIADWKSKSAEFILG